jgi:hypothetical protein
MQRIIEKNLASLLVMGLLSLPVSAFHQDAQVNEASATSVLETKLGKHELKAKSEQSAELQSVLIGQAKQKIKSFATELKAELVGAIKAGGLEAGVAVCHSKAPEIASRLSTDGWTVARTSLRTRNIKNAPDDWESNMLKQFDERFKQGEAASNLSAVLSTEDQFRLMKAIPMDQVCLACHGSSISPQLKSTLQKHYPNDTATGFSLEDIRGAFTLEKSVSE